MDDLLASLCEGLPPSCIPAADSAVVDARAQALGHSLQDLMTQAGSQLAAAIRARCPHGPAVLCCGSGNNGGDGWLAAELLQRDGYPLQVYPAAAARSPLAQWAAERAKASGVRCVDDPLSGSPALIVDAILGAGQRAALSDELRHLCQRLLDSGIPILACDVVTGIFHADGLRAQWALAMQCRKQENQDRQRCAEELVADLGIDPRAWLQVGHEVMTQFPWPDAGSHKGQNGRLLVIAGGPFPGAARLACQAALRSGCDLVWAWTAGNDPFPPSVLPLRQAGALLAPASAQALQAAMARVDAVLIGPGLGRHPDTVAAARQALQVAQEQQLPVVIDADAIAACRELIADWPATAAPLLITPHRREAEELLGQAPCPWASLHAWARPNRVLLAKGRVDFISDGRQWQYHCGGNPRMSMGGSGDCLAGLCAGLLARGAPPFAAARMAIWWLCRSADDCWQRLGPSYCHEDLDAALGPTLVACPSIGERLAATADH